MWASIDDIAQQASRYLGATVNVTGEVGQVFGPGVFSLAGEEGTAIVVAGAVTRERLRAGDLVELSGRVRAFFAPRIEAEIGYELKGVGLSEGAPVIVVRQVLSTSRRLSLAQHAR